MSTLVLRYMPDPADEVGQLWFDVRTAQFSGSGFFWSNLNELPGIISKLESYPLGDSAEWIWGYGQAEEPDAVLSLRVEQSSPTGDLKVRVGIRDLYEPEHFLRSTFQTDYASLEALRHELVQMREHRAGEAVLSGN
ncbi:hypothetical protein [Altericroceibacterium xinjiangense]|uniref:hypothetical protein n=1 Tax=Altericroceibacterium xinjiangense TaxID=762261 RepID=UPI000F7E1805|nr:hypothetical protein [Altericroceibacterium xinjiangense]